MKRKTKKPAVKKSTALAKRKTALVKAQPITVAEAIEKVLITGDLTPLSAEQRLDYYRAVCKSLGLNPLTRPFDYIAFRETEDSSPKLQLYARRDCTDQLRKLHGISVVNVARKTEGEMLIAEAKVINKEGKQDCAIGVVPMTKYNKYEKCFQPLIGRELANARMKAETKAKRRATLSICGLGFLDESEIGEIEGNYSMVTPNGRVIRDPETEVKTEPRELRTVNVKTEIFDGPILAAQAVPPYGMVIKMKHNDAIKVIVLTDTFADPRCEIQVAEELRGMSICAEVQEKKGSNGPYWDIVKVIGLQRLETAHAIDPSIPEKDEFGQPIRP